MNFSIKTLVSLSCATILFASCQKDVDVKEQIADVNAVVSSDATTAGEFPTCKLRRIYQSYGPEGPVVNSLFTYNSAGNPVSVLSSSDFAVQFYFFYDKKGRLIKLYESYPGGDNTDHYSYDVNNRIITDTSIQNEGGPYEYAYAIKLTYDSQGRIIKENIKNYHNGIREGVPDPLEPDRNPTYTYDVRGNLGVKGWKSSSYDNKVSIFRSHPIFQFIFRNYSRNNSSVQAKYNSVGLPLTVLPGNSYFFSLQNVDKAIYDCQ